MILNIARERRIISKIYVPLKEMYYLCGIYELPRKHIKAEYSNKNGWQLITSKSGNLPKVLIIKG